MNVEITQFEFVKGNMYRAGYNHIEGTVNGKPWFSQTPNRITPEASGGISKELSAAEIKAIHTHFGK